MARQRRVPPAAVASISRAVARTRPLFYGDPDPITLNMMRGLVTNVRTLQGELVRESQIDPRRDLADECGYPQGDASAEVYRDIIRWEPVAAAVAEIMTMEVFQVLPEVYDDDDVKVKTDFELAVKELSRRLDPEPAFHDDDLNIGINRALIKADIVSGYCRYGIAYIRLNDGKLPSEPATPSKNQKFMGIDSYPEYLARITNWETDRNSPRYGWPTMYNVYTSDANESIGSNSTEPMESEMVHWSRVVHLADDWHQASTSKCLAVPRIRPVLRPILDIMKVRGADAEGSYRAGFPGMQFTTHPQLGADVDIDLDDLREMYEEYANGMQRILAAVGGQFGMLAPSIGDPKVHLDVQLEAISIKKRWPKRILMGSERGEQSSIDDRKNWKGRLQGAQLNYYTPKLVQRVYNRLIALGCLPKPKRPYKTHWPDIDTLTDLEKAQVLQTRTAAYLQWTQGVEAIVPAMDFATRFDSMTVDDAKEMLEAAAENLDEGSDVGAPLLGLVGGVSAILEMFDRFQAKAISEDTLRELIMLFYKVTEEKANEIIAEGLPEQPDVGLPPVPPMKGPKAIKGPATQNELIANWLATTNLFCATGPGGGIDATCSPGQKKAKARKKKTVQAEEKAKKAADEAAAMQVTKPKPAKAAKPSAREKVKSALLRSSERVREEVSQYDHPLHSAFLESAVKTANMVQKMVGLDSTAAFAVASAALALQGPVLRKVKKGLKWLDRKLYARV